MAGKASWDLANRWQKLGLVWKIERKLAKLLMTTFTYHSPSYLLYGKRGQVSNILNFFGWITNTVPSAFLLTVDQRVNDFSIVTV